VATRCPERKKALQLLRSDLQMRFAFVSKVAPSIPNKPFPYGSVFQKSLAASSIRLSEKHLDRILRITWQGSISMSGGFLSQKWAGNLASFLTVTTSMDKRQYRQRHFRFRARFTEETGQIISLPRMREECVYEKR
jgi:hypothetical protein